MSVEILSDSFLRLLTDSTLLWGDLILEDEINNSTSISELIIEDEKPVALENSYEDDVLEGWTIPDLRLRKAIWENFPVDVIPMPNKDGTERHRIVWNKIRLNEWRQTRPTSWDEYQDYEGYCTVRLLTALAAHPHKYIVESSSDDSSICTIAMVHEPKTDQAVGYDRPMGKRALEVLSQYPVSWDRDGKIHRIKLHKKKAFEAGRSENDVAFDLIGALAECKDCIVTPACGGGYMMIVTML